ncbi:MAG TPA: hypothetical protein DIW24_04895, partial [Bacteroidetes bacterium]|nr:hypothetical protein [Bacteroidota bacterium]
MPHHASEAILQKYLKRLMDAQDNPALPPLTQADLDRAARELGITEQQKTALEDRAQASLERALNFRQHQLWNDAIRELQFVISVRPLDLRVLYELAEAHRQRWNLMKDPDDRKQAEALARRCVEIDPHYRPAYVVLSALGESMPKTRPNEAPLPRIPQKTTSPNRNALWTGMSILGVLVLILFFWLSPSSSKTTQNKLSGGLSVPDGTNSNTSSESVNDLQVPVETAFGTHDVSFEVQKSVLTPYEDAFSYVLRGYISSKTKEMVQLKVQLKALDKTGQTLFTEFKEVLPTYETNVRPGEVLPVDLLHYKAQKAPNVASVLLTIAEVDLESAPPQYQTDKPLELKWDIPKPSGFILETFLRNARTTGFGNTRNVWLEVVVKNKGPQSVRTLQLRTVFYDASGSEIGSKESFFVSGASSPPIRPNQAFTG